MSKRGIDSRRTFLASITSLGAGALLMPAARGAEEEHEEEVGPGEDLMREHGVLNRTLLVYEECVRRIGAQEDLDPKVIVGAADVIRTFIEDYHEKMEEQHLFPRFRQGGSLTELVDVLQRQHDAGRALTDRIRGLATLEAIRNPDDSRKLTDAIAQFIRMYRPHEAREDTVLFPALHRMLSESEYEELGEQFEGEEHRRFGEGGFAEYVEKVGALEKTVGINDLDRFTPKL